MAETYYKLVDENLLTRDDYQWVIGKRHRATGERGQGLCSDEYLHAYHSPAMAALTAEEAAAAAAWAAEAEAAAAEAEAEAAWTAAEAAAVNLPSVCELVLSTPEDEWSGLIGGDDG